MKNITVTLPDETALWVRVWAAKMDESVSSALAHLIEEIKNEEEGRQTAFGEFMGKGPRRISDGTPYPTRDSIHDR